MNPFADKKDYQRLYTQLGRLLEAAPDTSEFSELGSPVYQHWFGRAHALVEEVGIGVDAITMRTTLIPQFHTAAWQGALRQTFAIIYRALAKCELESPAAAAGAFVPVGNAFDAFAALTKLFSSATADVLVLDPYLDETVLTEFGLAVPVGVCVRLLADEAAHKPTLAPAAAKWIQQYGAGRPLQVRLAPAKSLHDRAIFVDHASAWTLTQSLKDFAKRSPAEIVRADDTADLKIAAYEAIWAASRVVV